jgi:hypothetical protein
MLKKLLKQVFGINYRFYWGNHLFGILIKGTRKRPNKKEKKKRIRYNALLLGIQKFSLICLVTNSK